MDLLTRLSAFITVMTICGADRHGRRGRHSPLLSLCGHLFIYLLGLLGGSCCRFVRVAAAPLYWFLCTGSRLFLFCLFCLFVYLSVDWISVQNDFCG